MAATGSKTEVLPAPDMSSAAQAALRAAAERRGMALNFSRVWSSDVGYGTRAGMCVCVCVCLHVCTCVCICV